MSGSVNKVILLGRLGRDPELKYTPSGSAICTFSVATDESYKDRNEQKVEKTEWHNVVIFGKLGEIANQYLTKGSQVYLEGKLETEEYTDKENVKRKTTKVKVSEMTMLGDRGHGETDNRPTPSNKPTQQRERTVSVPDVEDDLPF